MTLRRLATPRTAVFAVLAAPLAALVLLVPPLAPGAQRSVPASALAPAPLAATDPAMPWTPAFVRNDGQWPDAAAFAWCSGGVTVAVDPAGWRLTKVLGTARPASPRPLRSIDPGGARAAAMVRMTFRGASSAARLVPEQRLPGAFDYLVGPRERWRGAVPRYAALRYQALYPGVDVRMYTRGSQLEYDLLVAPGADLAAVSIDVEGADGLRVDDDGALCIDTPVGTLRQPAPWTYQTDARGVRESVPCAYELRGAAAFGFVTGARDLGLPLCIDPGLLWSAVLPGAGGGGFTEAADVQVDANGILTLAGVTREPAFMTTPGAFDPSHNGVTDLFAARLDPQQAGAAQLLQATFVGGSGGERPRDLQVDAGGMLTVVGQTGSVDFPVTPTAFSRTQNGAGDAFVLQLDLALAGAAQLRYSTFVGAGLGEHAAAVALGPAGTVSVVGDTASPGFPTTADAYDRSFGGGSQQFPYDSYLCVLDPALTGRDQLRYSTFLGGSSWEAAVAVAVDAQGVHIVAGETDSLNFPVTANAYAPFYSGGGDAFVLQLDRRKAGATQLVYGSFLGGDQSDWIDGMVVGPSGLLTLVGDTQSTTFPTTPQAFDTTRNGAALDGFVAQFAPGAATQLVWSTLLGGIENDDLVAVTVDAAGVVTVAGDTSSPDFPTTTGALANAFAGGAHDGILARLDPARAGAQQLLYGTFFGGGGAGTSPGDERVQALAAAALGRAVVVGSTDSDDYPTTAGALGGKTPGASDAFITLFDLQPTGVAPYGTSSPGCAGAVLASAVGLPQVGNTAFALRCSGAPPGLAGTLLFSATPLQAPIAVLGIGLWVAPPLVVLGVQADGRGLGELVLRIPARPALIGGTVAAQFVWFGPAQPSPCPPTGWSASDALAVTMQP